MGTNRHVLFSQTPFQKRGGRIDIKKLEFQKRMIFFDEI